MQCCVRSESATKPRTQNISNELAASLVYCNIQITSLASGMIIQMVFVAIHATGGSSESLQPFTCCTRNAILRFLHLVHTQYGSQGNC